MWKLLKNFFLPHEDNDHHPAIWQREGALFFLALIFFIEGYFLLGSYLILNKISFLASVFPNALVVLTNDVRENSHLAKLTESDLLTKAAQLKADDMAAKGYFAHYTPEGNSPWTFLRQVGYEFNYAGENLAINFVDSEDVVDAWVKSPTHYQNIVKGTYTQIGIATAEGKYQGRKTIFVAQFFGTPKVGTTGQSLIAANISQTGTTTLPRALQGSTTASGATTTPVAINGATTTEPKVFGLEIDATTGEEKEIRQESKVPLFLASPNHFVTTILLGLIALTLVLFVFSLRNHNSRHHGKIWKAAVYFIIILLLVIFFNHIFGAGVIG